MPRPARLPALLSVGALVALTGALTPAAAAPTGPPAVSGGAVQAWRATPYVKPSEAAATALYLAADGTASTAAPVAPVRAVEVVEPVAEELAAQPGRGGASWTAPWSGRVDGRVRVTLHWLADASTASLDPVDEVALRLFADPGTPHERLVGSGLARAAGPAVDGLVEVTSTVVASGDVRERLVLQLDVLGGTSGRPLRLALGSASAPSSLSVPVSGAAADGFPTTVAVEDDEPLVLSATYIGRKAAEPTIGITKAGNAFITAGDFDGLSPATPQTLIYGSYDGNTTWKDVTNRVAGQPYPPTTLDPYIYVDVETDRIYSDDLLVGCSLLQWSDDEGESWNLGTPLACEAPVDDHQTIVVGNPPAPLTTIGYPNVVYYCVNKVADAQCARSLDGGTTFSQSGAPAFLGVSAGGQQGEEQTGSGLCGGLHGHIITDPAGNLYLPKAHCGQPWVAVSEDGGTTWRQTLVHPMATAGTQTAIASDSAGNIYYTWWEAETRLPYMAVSTDAGRTFGPALLVGPPGLQGANFPSIDAGAPGQVAISYPGTLGDDPADPARPWNYYVMVTDDALAPQPVFHSATANAVTDPVHRGTCNGRCAGMFDFLDVVIAPTGDVWAAAVDTCTGPCATLGKDDAITPETRATDAQGVAVRQLRGRAAAVAPPAAPPVAAPPAAAPPTTLPTTGGGPGALGALAAVLAVGAVVTGRRSRRPAA